MEELKKTYLQVLCERNRAPVYEDLAIESGGTVESKFWKSKYNNFVVYEYEPFCADGFLVELNISFYNINRDDLENFSIMDLIEEKEFVAFSKPTLHNPFRCPLNFSINIEDEDYKYLFLDMIEYTEEKRNFDLTKMFTQIKMKMIEVYHDFDSYKKYIDSIDIDGSIDGCTYCESFNCKRDYCKKFNIVSPKKICMFYNFNKNVEK